MNTMCNVIEVGTHEEKLLIDYIANGSTVAKLHFDLGVVAIFKARNATMHGIMIVERDAAERAKQVRERVFKFAFRELRKWRA